MLSWGPPHNPYRDLPRRWLDRYPPAEAEVPANCPHPMREELAGYCAHVAALDEQLGRIEAALADAGVLENTIFVYTSDHGDMLGSQSVNRKQHPWDESILVPFLLRCPGGAGRGRRISFPLNVADILPTQLGLAGVPVPDSAEGRDLSPAVRGEPFAGNDAALTMCISPFAEYVGSPWRGVRTEHYSYARWLDSRGILYDTDADPDQLRNLFQDPVTARRGGNSKKRCSGCSRNGATGSCLPTPTANSTATRSTRAVRLSSRTERYQRVTQRPRSELRCYLVQGCASSTLDLNRIGPVRCGMRRRGQDLAPPWVSTISGRLTRQT